MLSHLGIYMPLPTELAGRLGPVTGGAAGVTFFFVLSGFLITTLLLREKESTGSISIRKFIARRLLRLMPALVVFIAAVALLMYFGLISKTWAGLLMAASYLYNFVGYGESYTPELAHTWSLAIEEHFYLMWPWLLLLTKTRRARAIKVATGPLLFCLLIRMVWEMLPFRRGGLSQEWRPFWWAAWQPCLAQPNWEGLNDWCQSVWWGYLGVLLWSLPLYLPTGSYKFIWTLQIIFIGMIVCGIAISPSSKIARVQSWRPLVYLGTISYGLYFWKELFITNGLGGEKTWIQQFPQNVALTFFAAVTSYHAIETVALKYKKKFSTTE